MSSWAVILGLLALAAEGLIPFLQQRAPAWGKRLIEGIAPLIRGPLPLGIALGAGWIDLREVGGIGPFRLTPGALLGWSPAEWVRGLGLMGIYGGITLLAFRGLGLWRPHAPQWTERVEHGGSALARETLLALWRAILMTTVFPQHSLPAAWLAFGLWWGTVYGFGQRLGTPLPPGTWGSALTATALFGLTGNLWLSAAVHVLTAGALTEARGEQSSPTPLPLDDEGAR